MRLRAFLYAFVPALLLLLLLISSPSFAQFDTEYWMPPVWESRDDGLTSPGGKTSPTELVITTAYENALVEVFLSNGTPVGSGTARQGDPLIVNLSEVQGMTFFANTVEDDKGLRITSDFPIQVVYRNTSDNNQCLAPLKGTFALGNDFIAGTQTRVTNNSYGKDDIHFVSVMATEDETEVTLVAPGPYFATDSGPLNTVTVTLDRNQTYLVRNNNQDNRDPGGNFYIGNNRTANLAGTRITSNKPIAVMTGGQHVRYEDGDIPPDNETDADAGIDQAVPIESDIFDMIGTEYVIVRGGTELVPNPAIPGYVDKTDYAIIIATEDNTVVNVNGAEVTTIAEAGDIYEYTLAGGAAALGTPFYIETDKKSYLYHVSGLRRHELGMSAVPTIDCAGSQYIAFNRFDNPDPSIPITDPRSYDNTINVIGTATAFETLTINGSDYLGYLADPKYNFLGLKTVPGNSEWRTATFIFPKDDPENIIISSEDLFHVGVVVGGNEGGTYGYLSSFARKVDVLDPNQLPLRLPTSIYQVGAIGQGDTLTHCLELVSCDSDHTIEAITPSANTGDAFRQGEEGEPEDICLQYVAKPDYLGSDTITVLVRNARGIPGRVQLVFDVVQPPTAVADTFAVAQDGTVIGNVLDNDLNVEAGETAELVSDVGNGTATLNPDGTFTYTPDAGFVGTDTLRYQVCDAVATQTCSEATVLFRVGFFVDDVLKTAPQDQPVPFTTTDFSEQFFDAAGGTLTTVQIVSLPDTGSLTLDGAPVTAGQEIAAGDLGSLVYTPPPGYTDTVRFEWNGSNGTAYAAEPAQVIIALTDSDGVFSAQDSVYTLDRNTTYSDDLTSNVSDPSGAGFTFTTDPLTGPQNGTITINPDGTFTYTPSVDFFGRDSVTYEVCPTADPTDCAQATAYFDVRIPDDDPTDTDEDGIPDVVEVGEDQNNPTDTDEDGTPDYLDEDSDDDGIPDDVEAGSDPSDPVDTDEDGIPDYQDTDSDDDGIPDSVEAGDDPTNPADEDEDGIPNYLDEDSDGDTIPDSVEAGDDPTNPVDTDSDGTPDYLDLDSDDDTIPDVVEAGDDPTNPVDTDNDGTADFRDTNSDDDSLTDEEEAGPDPNNPQDTDDDGLPDYRDTDQGITVYEGFSPGGANDTWVIDGIQAFPNNNVKIFNRWGNKVYEVDGYNNVDRVWRGDSNVSSVGGNEVPDGTYFYIIDLGEGDKPRTGYVVVNR